MAVCQRRKYDFPLDPNLLHKAARQQTLTGYKQYCTTCFVNTVHERNMQDSRQATLLCAFGIHRREDRDAGHGDGSVAFLPAAFQS